MSRDKIFKDICNGWRLDDFDIHTENLAFYEKFKKDEKERIKLEDIRRKILTKMKN